MGLYDWNTFAKQYGFDKDSIYPKETYTNTKIPYRNPDDINIWAGGNTFSQAFPNTLGKTFKSFDIPNFNTPNLNTPTSVPTPKVDTPVSTNVYSPDQQPYADAYLKSGGKNGSILDDYYNKNGIDKSNQSFLSGYGEAAGKWLKQNPMAPIALGLQLWQGINSYNANKQFMNQEQEKLNLQKQAYYDNKARMDEQYNIWKNARAGSSL